ncbi:MAG: FMN-binding negative transcriptional regulator [Burkholderiaceae bacterium]
MYLTPNFKSEDPSHARDLIRAHPLAQLISVDDAGLPFVTPLPLHLEEDGGDGGQWVLLGHCAKANPHWRYLEARPRAVVTFMGPHAYMTPRVYPDQERVPTWNYLMVHCTVEARLVASFSDKDRLLKHLIHDHDPAYAAQWRGLDEAYQQKMMNGIVAFELHVVERQCKLKLNQHRPEAHAAMHGGLIGGNEMERALAQWMNRLGMVGSDPVAEPVRD